jgi:hypothetical protein
MLDTSTVATDTIDYAATLPAQAGDENGLTSTSTRTVIIQAANAPSIVPRTMPPPLRQPQHLNNAVPLGVVHGAFGFDRGAAFFLCLFDTDFASVAFARARAALLVAARLSGDHGVYLKSG